MKLFKLFLVVWIVLSMVVAPVMADEISEVKAMVEQMKKDYEAKIESLENKITALELNQEQKIDERVSELKNDIKEEVKSASVQAEYVGRHQAPVGDGGLVVKNPFGFGNVSVGGYADVEYGDFENTDATFNQHRWVVNIGAFPHERLRFISELEIEYGGPNAPNADGEVKVEQAYMDYLINDAVNVRAGALLIPFGRYNLNHDSDLQKLTDRPIVARDVIPTTWTEAGAGVFGGFNPALGSYEDLNLNYELYVVNGLDAGFSDTGLSGARSSLKTDNNDDKAFVGRLAVSPWLNQEIGVSGYWGEYDTSSHDIAGLGVDSLITVGPFEWINEFAYFDVEEASTDVANYFQGAYSQLNYAFWPKFLDHSFLGRDFKNPKLNLVGRYDWGLISDDNDASLGNNEESRWTLGLNYRPVENFVYKFEYQWNKTSNEVLERGDNNGFLTSMAIGF